MSTRSPRELALEQAASPRLPDGDDERFAGYGVMGLPFTSGHYLALRNFPATSLGAGYRAVWHRDPDGAWTIYATEPPEVSCARYFGAALSATATTPIDVTWTGAQAFRVTIPGVLDWEVELGRTAATAVLSRMGGLLPERAWRSDAVLAPMGPVAGALLRAGRVGLRGTTPNGQHFTAGPRLIWTVAASSARLDGVDLGRPGALPVQDHLGDFWLPQRGIFAIGQTCYEVYDPSRHLPARPAGSARAEAGEAARVHRHDVHPIA
jgi:hypothetical protein